MSILEQYKKQYGSFQQSAPTPPLSSEYGFIVRLVIRLSNGKLQDPSRINAILITVSVFILAALFFLLIFTGFGGTRVINGGHGPSQRELDTYRQLQPF